MQNKQINHTLSYENLGTHWHILIYDDITLDTVEELNSHIQWYLGSFERTYSRFRHDSIVSQLSNEWIISHPSQELVDMLHFVMDIEERSEWYFSILLADTLTYNGYGKHSWEDTPKDIVPLKSVLTIESDKITLKPGWSLDFWWFGKWWAVDAVASLIQKHGIKHAVVNGWGDIRVVDNTLPYTLVLEDPMDGSKSISNITFSQGWVAASSAQRRKRVHAWKSHHHLINPHTKESVKSDVMAVHTYAKNTLMADVASTILFVCPLEKIESIAQKLWVEYFLVFDDYSIIRSKGYPIHLANSE